VKTDPVLAQDWTGRTVPVFAWGFSVRGRGRFLNFSGERISGVVTDSRSAVDYMPAAENILESSWTSAGDTGEAKKEV
jgi:hypothetical protein